MILGTRKCLPDADGALANQRSASGTDVTTSSRNGVAIGVT